MVVGGLTQYKAQVQSMPKEVADQIEKKIHKFFWDDKSATVNINTIRLPINEGGRNLLDIKARNEAIELMKLRNFTKPPKDRPRWAKVADQILVLNANQAFDVPDVAKEDNYFLQNWTAKLQSNPNIPDSLRDMLATARKYNVGVHDVNPGKQMREQMPIWHHIGFDPNKRSYRTHKWVRCQQQNHHISLTGQMAAFAHRNNGRGHLRRRNCKCALCKEDRAAGCNNPALCREAAAKVLDILLPNWDPRKAEDIPGLSAQDVETNNRNIMTNKPVIFNPKTSTDGTPLSNLRVFRSKPPMPEPGDRQVQAYPPVFEEEPEPEPDPEDKQVIYLASTCKNTNTETATSSGVAWYAGNNAKNFTIKRTGPTQTARRSMLTLLQLILRDEQHTVKLDFKSKSPHLTKMLHEQIHHLEDCGWTKDHDADILQEILNLLRQRKAQTTFQTITEDEPDEWTTLEEAQNLISPAHGEVRNDRPDEPPREQPTTQHQIGIKIQAMSQSTAYKAIMRREKEKVEPRRQTLINLDKTRYAAEEIGRCLPTDKQIWAAIKKRDISVRGRAFLWKTMHDAYKVGEYWERIPGYEIRGYCHVCQTTDTMEHILTECRATGQEAVWQAAEELWSLRKLDWKKPKIGHILGCGLANFHPEKKRTTLTGANRLYAILISESAHLIWKTRCKWKIEHGARDDKIISDDGIRQKWIQTINRRLKIDCLSTNERRYGKRALNPSLVQKTWWGVLLNQGDLGDDWLTAAGVLVGIEGRPSGRNR
ncbi:hypothetical protein JR316_0007354 [Psilocybe cubensis]|uniref:Uncharacterized protein n=1 Tax=Psilocybe cubensis TaxID=181762 RepID=A0ACB8H0H6_PSICU|nr:hypothetical protein JR316_0007354 [Psilocybe cubensis]KAH9480754.1 hypothetical protein JR316_0007354 [Psilocybe cubensis]